MFKKKKKDLNTPADLQLKILWERHLDVSNNINTSIRNIIVKKKSLKSIQMEQIRTKLLKIVNLNKDIY